MTYNEAIKKIGNQDSKKIGNNTYLVRRENECVAIRLHTTDILIFHSDDSVIVHTGGFYSNITKARINEHLPSPRLYSKNGVWFWSVNDGVPFAEWDIVTSKGCILDKNGASKMI